MTKLGVIHGRFQILHNDHVKYLLAGKSKCEHLVVGITNPDPTLTKADTADPQRSNPHSNPLNYFERYTMVKDVLLEAGLEHSDFSIVPFPVSSPELYKYYVPLDATFYLTIYDPWGKRKLEMFRSAGLRTEILWEKPFEEKGLSASQVRGLIADDGVWKPLVPSATAALVEKWNLAQRFKGSARL